MTDVSVVFGDIFQQDVEAIVNPANQWMLHGGGLAGQIARRAGEGMIKASRAELPVPTGSAITTTAGQLPFKAVIHVVGPVWESDDSNPYWRRNSSDEDPDELLKRAHFAVIKAAWERGLTSVALPAISCGVFRFPVERAAPIAVNAVRLALREYSPPVKRVVFCLLDDDYFDAFIRADELWGGDDA